MNKSRFYSDVFKTVLGHSLDLFAYLDKNSIYQYVSQSYAEFYNFKIDDLIGKTPQQVFDKNTFENIISPHLSQCFDTRKSIHYESWIIAQNIQEPHYLYISYLPHIDSETGEILGIIVISKDVSEFKRAEGLLAKSANTDALTNIPNRLYLENKLEELTQNHFRDSDRFALLFCDLNGFKQVNDQLGHAIGDKILKQAAHRLQNNTRQEDIIARYGGDEFVILMNPLKSLDVVDVVKEKIARSFCQPFEISGHFMKVGVSIGVSIYPDDATTVAELMQTADKRMYKNKKQKM